jgi:NAD(P)H-dependent flavin oxidoreductase YrpB (nitropropane dioxygenase family)
MQHPVLIQGGMGVAVSNWKLAKTVSKSGHLGVISGTCIDSVVVRRLQEGDPDGDVRRAMSHFPRPDIAEEVIRKYYIPEGIAPGKPYKMLPMFGPKDDLDRQLIATLAAFVEVYLAKEGHSGVVGINLLTKIQLPNLPTLYGAMLAGVDYGSRYSPRNSGSHRRVS